MDTIKVRLSTRNDYETTCDFNFRLESNHFVKKWLSRYKEAQQRGYPISEPDAFYNLNMDWSENRILDNINELIRQMPNMFGGVELGSTDDQDTLNHIHSVFEIYHGSLDAWQGSGLTLEEQQRLSKVNQLVHRAENFGADKRIRVVWFDLPKTKTYDIEDYKLFQNTKEFGGVYVMYADVGKNVESLAKDNDDHHHDFVPNLHYSSDFIISFSDTKDNSALYEQYKIDNSEYFIDKGYDIGDPRLTTGNIKIAQLDSTQSQEDILDTLSKYNHVQSVYVI